ncbi:Inherit from bactNOG: repeat protein [Seminavis robusta]|uniref:Inherit from bactNOG: repeat protein n=1 Tax=Seminavis robusta TaxID=568900 RepID=A0A9N8DKN3_9STRA|nr:Inherit from bactNOG: repeat protein [Seminavis robusta]|eukprot:Sro195_g083090.1 Inherit from bactNOG: repeat protein (2110) ;mRNA; r:2335-9963
MKARYASVLLRLFVVVISSRRRGAHARLGGANVTARSLFDGAKPKHHRSLEDLSNSVFEELRVLQEHGSGPHVAISVPLVVQKVHRTLVEGSAGEGEDFGPHARRRALQALGDGGDRLIHLLLSRDDGDRALAKKSSNWEDNKAGIAGFTAVMIFFSVLLISNIVAGAGGAKPWPFLGNDNAYFQGTPGRSFRNISPCSKLPMQSDALWSYFPITQGFLGNIRSGAGDAIDQVLGENNSILRMMELLLNPETVADVEDLPNAENCFQITEECQLTAECCRKEGFLVNCNEDTLRCEEKRLAEVAGGTFAVEPFCLAFTRTAPDSLTPDSLAFAPRSPWPPMDLDFGASGLISDENCRFHSGWPTVEIPVFKILTKLTIQFDGIALSWADNAKLAFGTNADTSGERSPVIWDGFRNQPLPEVPDISFWLRLRFSLVELKSWKATKKWCEKDGWTGAFKEYIGKEKKDREGFYTFLTDEKKEKRKESPLTLSIVFDVELYIAIDKQTVTAEDGETLGSTLAKEIGAPEQEEVQRRSLFSSDRDSGQMWRNVQESTTREDPCVILTMPRAAFKIPLFGGHLVFGNAIGGFCNFPAEETGVFCTPSGWFFNIQQQFQIEGGLGGILSRALEQAIPDNDVLPPLESAGNSIGVFQDAEGRTEAVVFRLEFPVNTLFGVPLGGGARPVIHFQYVKGSEVERRRQTLLRSRPIPETGEQPRPWVTNCVNVLLRCQTWSKFVMHGDAGTEWEICSDILINPEQHPDKLLCYNRVLTAEPTDPEEKYKITPDEDAAYQTPAKYDFSSNADADVFILYFALKDFGNLVILVKEVSISLVLSDGPPPTRFEDVADDFRVAQLAYDALPEDMKEIFSPPSLFNFPSLQAYLDYIDHGQDDVVTDGKLLEVQQFDDITASNNSENLAMFLRVFCKISVLFFLSISVGLIVENFADGVSPNQYGVAGQFEFDTVGFRWSVAVSTEIDFDRRRHLHLEGEDYRRALASDGLEKADWSVDVSMACAPDSLCDAIVEFFEDVGEAIWEGMQAIATFFAEDVVEFFNSAVAAVGEWGKQLMGSIVEFGTNVVNNIRDVFENGEVAQLLSSERLDAFGADAHKAIAGLTDGKITLDDLKNVGKAVLEGAKIVIDFIVAGITDIINAIGSFFKDLGDFFRKGFGRQDWVEFRTKSSFENIHSCKAACDRAVESGRSVNIKRNCWCKDELECPVKVAQRRKCKKTCGFWICGPNRCESWRDVEVERKGGFPRFESRVFDQACRLERAAKLAEAEEFHGNMVQTSDLVDRNMQKSFAGLQNFSPSATRRRKLSQMKPVTQVRSFSVPAFRAVNEGTFGPTDFQGRYMGAQLRPDSIDVDEIQSDFVRKVDFSQFKREPGKPEFPPGDDSIMVHEARLGAVNQYLGALQMDDPVWAEKQPTLSPPKISLAWGSPGSSSQDPVVFGCEGPLAEAWRAKLEGSEPESMRRTRRRRLEGHAELTVIELVLVGILRHRILEEDGIKVDIEYGDFVGEETDADVFARARDLIGEDGVQIAEPKCESIRWTFEVVASDQSGRKSETMLVYGILPYGFSELEKPPEEHIQTVCDSDPFGADDLDDNFILKDFYNVSSFAPKLRNDNCRSPFAELSSFDKEIKAGIPCSENYKMIHRKWLLTDPTCQMQDTVAYQKITLGGLEIEETGEPDTPILNLQIRNVSLPNERNAFVSLSPSDFFLDGEEPSSLCGMCDIPEVPAVSFSSPLDPLGCEDIGVHEVSITAVNRIGISVTKTALVNVVDDVPPNVITKTHVVALNAFGWMDEAVTTDDIDNGTWDNCGLVVMRISQPPNFGCGDEGTQSVVLTAKDSSGNQVSTEQEVFVTDARPGIGLRRGNAQDGLARLLSEQIGVITTRAKGPRGARDVTSRFQDNTQTRRALKKGMGGMMWGAMMAWDDSSEEEAFVDTGESVDAGESGEYLSLPTQEPSEIDGLIDDAMQKDFGYANCEEIAVYVKPYGQDHFLRLHHFAGDPSAEWSIPSMYNRTNTDSVVFFEAVCRGLTVEEQMAGQECRAEVKAEVLCEDSDKILRETCYRASILYDSDAVPTFNDASDLPGYVRRQLHEEREIGVDDGEHDGQPSSP